jgi:hypothetical protein
MTVNKQAESKKTLVSAPLLDPGERQERRRAEGNIHSHIQIGSLEPARYKVLGGGHKKGKESWGCNVRDILQQRSADIPEPWRGAARVILEDLT